MSRSLTLAAAMASHGYGRTGRVDPRTRLLTGGLVLTGLLGVCVGLYGAMSGTTSRYLGAPLLLGALAVAVTGFFLGGRRVRRSRYRPDRWRAAELLAASSGIAAGALMYVASRTDAATLHPALDPISWPQVALLPATAVLLGVLPAFLTPQPDSTAKGIAA